MAKKKATKATNPVSESKNIEPAAKKNVAAGSKPTLNRTVTGNLKSVNPLIFSLIVTGVFFILVLVGLVHHDMWRDELQAWLVARDARSISQLFQNMKYEGNPALWHFFLFLITRFTHNPAYMQALHLVIACGFIFVFNRYSEIGMPYKIMFSFGYFTLYEYSIISRSYGLGILLLFIVCALYKNRYAHYILMGIALALLANISIYTVIFSLGISGILALDYLYYQQKNSKQLAKLIAGLAIAIVGVVASLYQIMPEKDNTFGMGYAKGLFEMDRWGYAFSKIFTSYFYIPKTDGIYGTYFWNSNYYYDEYPQIQQPLWSWLPAHTEYLWAWYCLPAMAFILSSIIFIRKPMILLLYTGVTLCLVAVYYYTYLMFLRYTGFTLIILIVCYWLEKYYPDQRYRNPALIFLSGLGKKIQTPLLVLILATNIAGGAVAYSKGYANKFSVSKDVAEFIHENKLDTLTIAGVKNTITSPLAAYLDTKIFYPQMNDFGSFCVYNKNFKEFLPMPEIVKSISNIMTKDRKKLLLVFSFQLEASSGGGKTNVKIEHGMLAPDIKIGLIKSFESGVVYDEKYYLYLAQKTDGMK